MNKYTKWILESFVTYPNEFLQTIILSSCQNYSEMFGYQIMNKQLIILL